MIYLDNAATTFPKPEEVYQTVDYVQRNLAVNIGRGSYTVANEAMKIVDETRFLLAKLVGIEHPNNVIFTPSATIAANEVIYGLNWDEFKTVYITPFEHNAIARPLEFIRKKYGIKICMLPFDLQSQQIDYEKTSVLFSSNPPDYVFLNQVSNVTGTVIPIKEISAMAKKYDAIVIVDGAQSVGLLDINMLRDGIDYLIFAGHKNMYASWGVGGFISLRDPKLVSIITGGTGSDSLDLTMGNSSPVRFEPASPNIIALASLNSSLKWLNQTTMEKIGEKKKELVNILVEGLTERGCKMYMPQEPV